LRQCDARGGRDRRGSSREMQELATRKFHHVLR
jgi:hypothetical protein